MKPTNEMIDRFLAYQLPKDFNPDGGISYDRTNLDKWPEIGMPHGTNLLDWQQAKDMLEFVLGSQ